MRARLAFAVSAFAIFIVLIWLARHFRSARSDTESPISTTLSPPAVTSAESTATSSGSASSDSAATNVYAHNLMLRKGPGFRVYVPWLRGRMIRTARNINPSFDDPDSFVINVETGVIHTNVGDLTNFLNDGVANSPLRKISLSGDG